MLPLLFGLVGVAVISKIAVSGSEARQRATLEFDKHFIPLPGDRRIFVDQHFDPSVGRLVRRYRPAFEPVPWEIYVAADDEGMEHFALSFHPSFRPPYVTIRPVRRYNRRPIHIRRVFEEEREFRVARDPSYDNRFRYSHPEEGVVEWFIVHIEPSSRHSWMFEHHSLHLELVHSRPALPTSSAAPQQASDAEAPLAEARRRAEQVATELVQLRAEIPEMINEARRYAASPEGVDERLAMIKKIADATQRALYDIESATDTDELVKEHMRDIILLVSNTNFERFRQLVEAEFDAVKRGQS